MACLADRPLALLGTFRPIKMTSDPKILILAFLGGIIPALLWLWFWIKEEENKPEPKGLLAAVFITWVWWE
jgi:RsiW-degrading membrane proteinase PrsW (M82 family)